MLKWVFGADTGPFRRGLNQMRSDTQAFAGDIKGMIAGALSLGAITVGLKKVLSAASDLEEAMSKSETYFGDHAKEVQEWSSGLSKNFGQSQKSALAAAASFGGIFDTLGYGAEESANMSKRLVELASDMASINDTSPEEAIEALNAGLRGVSVPLRRYSVLLEDSMLKAEAMAMGIYNGVGSLSVQARTQASYNLILKQTTIAQGDFAKNANQVANSERVVAAEAENAAAAIGTKLLPQYQALLDRIKDTDVGPLAEGVGWLVSNIIKVVRTVTTLIGVSVGAIISNFQAAFDFVAGGFRSLGTMIEGALTLDKSKIQDGMKAYKTAITTLGNDVKRNLVSAVGSAVEESFRIWEDVEAPKPAGRASKAAQQEGMEIAKERMKLEEEIAKLEEEARLKTLSLEERILELKKQQAEAVADAIFEDGNAQLEGRKRELEIAKEIADLEKKRDDERKQVTDEIAARSKSLADAAAAEAKQDKENRRANMTEEQRLADLLKEQKDLLRQAKESTKVGDYLDAIQKRTEAKGMQGDIDALMESINKSRVPTVISDDLRKVGGGGGAVLATQNPMSGTESRLDRAITILNSIDKKTKNRVTDVPNPFSNGF